jgi:hypothetical protein
MRNFSDKVVEKIKTHISLSITFFENSASYEIMWKNHSRAGEDTDYDSGHARFTLGG